MGLKIKPSSPSQPPALWQPEIIPLAQRTTPYPDDRPLDHDEVKSALWHARGNLHRAAQLLQTPHARLGALLRKDPALAEIRTQAAELIIDKAEEVVIEALEADDDLRRDSASKFVLEKAGRQRGWTKDGATGVAMDFSTTAKSGAIAVRWQVEDDDA